MQKIQNLVDFRFALLFNTSVLWLYKNLTEILVIMREQISLKEQ
ncbi:hypothetical protein [Helicobacter sp. 23-1046]